MKLVKSVVCVALLVSLVLVGLSTSAVAQGLTDEEEAGLLYMWEEEKLARDVYTVMYETWGKLIFGNIMASEQTHMDAVNGLIDRYRVENPAADNGDGVFTNSVIQALFTGLVEIGDDSLVKALCVGVFIEDTDIDDLTYYLSKTSKRDITRVYTNLRDGSYSHLDAFNLQLDLLGESCEPYEGEFNALLNSLK